MAVNATVDMLYDIVAEGGGEFHRLKTTLDEAPQPFTDALKAYVAAGNFDMSNVDNDAYQGKWFDDDRESWLFTSVVLTPTRSGERSSSVRRHPT
jgi:hypothetical protein